MELYPAIDLLNGQAVRLYQGDYARETVYNSDPVAQAKVFADAGARWIHVVDLDAARTGSPLNREVIAAICDAVDVPIQTGGGVRSEEAADALFDAGVARVVLGTAALENPDLVRALAARHAVAVGLDARGREVAVRGWEEGSGKDLLDVARGLRDALRPVFLVVVLNVAVCQHARPVGCVGCVPIRFQAHVDVLKEPNVSQHEGVG